MHLEEVNDDLGTAKKPFRVIACIAVQGRLPLLKHTISRLYKKNGCHKVICAGDNIQEREFCESLGAVWVHARNKPLGLKWNMAFQKAKDYNPDAVLYVGSSDFISHDWITIMRPYIEKYDFVGMSGCYFVDSQNSNLRACWWPGYKSNQIHNDRADETIGIGRMISSRLMDKLGWQPFDSHFDNSLDRSMKDRCKKYGGINDYHVDGPKSFSLSFPLLWNNKHSFEKQWSQATEEQRIYDAKDFCSNYIPEILSL